MPRSKEIKKTWRDRLDERMLRLRFSDESMIHFRKSKDYLNLPKMNFKNNTDMVNGLMEVDETTPLQENDVQDDQAEEKNKKDQL